MTRLTIAIVLSTTSAFAHCDSLDGPVVQAAQRALKARDVNHVLPWVPPSQENVVKAEFEQAVRAGVKGQTKFFETVVRVHRIGEGATYDGLKAAGFTVDPVLSAADRAVESKTLKPLLSQFPSGIPDELGAKFKLVLDKSRYSVQDVASGREYVKAYVDFIHFAEALKSERKTAAHDHHH